MIEVVVIASDEDPVARALVDRWGTPPASAFRVEGSPLRELTPTTLLLRRAVPHVHDESVDLVLPPELRVRRPTLVFPSIHRSDRNVECLTVHPLGNLGTRAELGGQARSLAPTDPRRMASALRRLDEEGSKCGWRATYEATHHGPFVELPAFFVEIGYGERSVPPREALAALDATLRELSVDRNDRIALGVGGGHYVPHFTELSLERRWAFGHLVPRHALNELARATVEEALARTEGAEGIVFSRAQDAALSAFAGTASRLRDNEAPLRAHPANDPVTDGARSASGT